MRNFEKHENSSKCINTPEKSLKYSQAGIKLNNTRNDRVQYTGEKLLKYFKVGSSSVIMSLILITTLFYKALMDQRAISSYHL